MKIIMLIFMLFLIPLGTSCNNSNIEDVDTMYFEMMGIVKNVGERIEIEVIESNYAFGIYWIITSDETKYYNNSYEEISKDDLFIGDKIIITYSGQVMMSYPPQVVAYKIKLIEK